MAIRDDHIDVKAVVLHEGYHSLQPLYLAPCSILHLIALKHNCQSLIKIHVLKYEQGGVKLHVLGCLALNQKYNFFLYAHRDSRIEYQLQVNRLIFKTHLYDLYVEHFVDLLLNDSEGAILCTVARTVRPPVPRQHNFSIVFLFDLLYHIILLVPPDLDDSRLEVLPLVAEERALGDDSDPHVLQHPQRLYGVAASKENGPRQQQVTCGHVSHVWLAVP